MPIVSIVRVENNDVLDAVRHAGELVNGFDIIKPGMTVLVKPNLVKPVESGTGTTTDARVTDAVVQLVLERKPARVILGEGSSIGYDIVGKVDSLTCFEATGTADVARKYGLEMVDLNRDEVVQVAAKDAFVMPTFGVAKTAYEADIIVDLPVIKTHGRTGITCAMKNMKGVLPGVEKKRTHRMGLDRAIVDLNRVMKPHLVVVDALMGLSGTHTEPEDRIPFERVLCGLDAVAVDAVATAMMGFEIEEIHHVRLAGEAGVGEADIGKIEIRGDSLENAARRVVRYADAAKKHFGDVTIIEEATCTGCWGEMESAFLYLNRAGYNYRLKDLTMILGMPDELPPLENTPLVVGKCPLKYRNLGVYLPGCPPHGLKIADGMCEVLGIDKKEIHQVIEQLHSVKSYVEVQNE
jgi:uncharacterized protein (DUF362 family)